MGGFHHGSRDNDDSVLLAGGGYKSVSDFLLSQDHYKTSPGAGTAGTSSATSGSTLSVPYVTVNANGHVTAYGTHTHTISGFLTAQDHYKTSPGAGTAGTSSATSGSTLSVPYVTINANGHVTGYGTHTHTISGFLTALDHYKTSPGAGTAGTSSATSGSALAVPYITVNANGHITGYGTHTHTVTGFTDNKVYQIPTSNSNANYRVLFKYTANDTAETTYVRSCTNLYYNMSTYQLTNNGAIQATQFKGAGVSNMWVNGRNGAILRETSNSGYHTIWSLKTTNGSWDCGEYNATNFSNKLVLSYITDTNYNNQTNDVTYQIIFPQKSGTVALTSDIPTFSLSYGYIATTAVLSSSTPALAITGTGTITPNSNASYNLGSTSYYWNVGYIRNLFSDTTLTLRSGSSASMLFLTSGANTRMCIDSSGNVGIGTTSPVSKLNVIGEAVIGEASYTSPLGTNSKYNGTWIGQGWLELSSSNPYINFHGNKDTADYTSRLIHWSSKYRLSYECSSTAYSGYVATCEGNSLNPVIIGIFDLYKTSASSTLWNITNICGPCLFSLSLITGGPDVSWSNSGSSWTISSSNLRVYVNGPIATAASKSTPCAISCSANVMTRWVDGKPVVSNVKHSDWQATSVECLCTNLYPGNSLYYSSSGGGRYIYITASRPWGYDDDPNGLGMDGMRQTGNLSYQRIRFTVFGYIS